ncbi:CerR family C-terminal domain-containing protein [Anaerobaca lacustris]|uniref:CerR family C-terminal domain-containing protein n=1 Tax=Anaerobaca lacustris TaxID=3044600 RepID=A0AAW6TZW8_9BACT|nr:CerR family C-terminal domain-containing protein [Sedimentisphaerales bacterium M17dextr]
MARRRDGIETRSRILAVAQEVFAEKGYREATVEDICSRAKSNIAAINYHFGSKEELYAQVWRKAFDEANEAYPPEGGLGPDAPAEDRLRGTIHSLVGKLVDRGRIGHSGKLLLREMMNPTEVIERVKDDALRPMQERMRRLMKEMLGPGASDEQIHLCGMSVVHQCLAIGIRLFSGKIPPHVRFDAPTDQLVKTLTDHIARFSLAGIRTIRQDIESGPDQMPERESRMADSSSVMGSRSARPCVGINPK